VEAKKGKGLSNVLCMYDVHVAGEAVALCCMSAGCSLLAKCRDILPCLAITAISEFSSSRLGLELVVSLVYGACLTLITVAWALLEHLTKPQFGREEREETASERGLGQDASERG